MKIGIDISQIVYGTGVSRYTQELVENLTRIDKKNQYVLFFSSLRQKIQNSRLCQDFGGQAKIKTFTFPSSFLELLWNRLHIINIENFIGKVDIFHSSDWTQPPSKARKVTTIHDVSFLHYPESFPKKIIEVHQRRLKWVRRECDLVIADSEATKKDLIKLLGFDEKKIKVIYLGVNKLKIPAYALEPIHRPIRPCLPRDATADKQNLKLTDKYFLYIGTLQPRKNLIRLIEAFKRVKKVKMDEKGEEIKLVLAGKKGWLYEEIFQKVKELELENSVIFTGFVTEEEKTALLKNALSFVYPSLYEGFGLPVLEAMSAGCPVITSNVSSLPEITGETAILINPNKTEEIESALRKIINNPKLVMELRDKGKKQAEKFTWEKTAQETLKVYEELL